VKNEAWKIFLLAIWLEFCLTVDQFSFQENKMYFFCSSFFAFYLWYGFYFMPSARGAGLLA
jgi:hypothetical protein